MKIKAINKIILAGVITVTILAFIIITMLDVPVLSTKTEVIGTLVGIYQTQKRSHVMDDRFLVKLDNGDIVQASIPHGVGFIKGERVIICEYTTKVLKNKVYMFEGYVQDANK